MVFLNLFQNAKVNQIGSTHEQDEKVRYLKRSESVHKVSGDHCKEKGERVEDTDIL